MDTKAKHKKLNETVIYCNLISMLLQGRLLVLNMQLAS